uniref:Putative DNA binding, helix-turn-helix domain containing protein n=1 Tax=viral metagenome TaxID=1070528 RepID=A0A6M3K404_9ZZZZ
MYKSPVEAANALKMSRQAVYQLIARGILKTRIVAGRRLVVVSKAFKEIERKRHSIEREPYVTGAYYSVRACSCCGVESELSNASVVCHGCASAINAIASEVKRIVAKAIRAGTIPKARGQVCADCKGEATEWDHRYYGEPLNVEPVCRRCNKLRGYALDAMQLVRLR